MLLIGLIIVACGAKNDNNVVTTNQTNNNSKPNILLITLDDMNWNTPASFGGDIPDISPHIDALAESGVQFNNAYVQAANCSPSRVVIQTGLYPHQSGMQGFYFVNKNIQTLSGLLKNAGYYTGVINKKADTSTHPDYDDDWNEHSSFPGSKKRSAQVYGDAFKSFLENAEAEKKPYYCVLNIADPHKPFFNDKQSIKKGYDKFKPSKIYTPKDVVIPDFLPETTEIKQQFLNYINSVKRGDDCVGSIMDVLKSSPMKENTIVIFLSDHGMPFPFAKSTVYQNGLKTPFIVSWPAKLKPRKDDTTLLSAVDIAPTLLDIVGLNQPVAMSGKSIYPALKSANEALENPYVFGQFDENAGGIPNPSRTAISKRYGYVFNPWATGDHKFISASTHQPTYKQMKKMSKIDSKVGTRFQFWLYRTIEEFYDYENDPDALNNLISDPLYKDLIQQHKDALRQHMLSTNDYTLVAFDNLGDINFLNSWMKNQEKEAKWRCENIKWKRGKNHLGTTKGNHMLFDNNKN